MALDRYGRKGRRKLQKLLGYNTSILPELLFRRPPGCRELVLAAASCEVCCWSDRVAQLVEQRTFKGLPSLPRGSSCFRLRPSQPYNVTHSLPYLSGPVRRI